MVSIESSTQRSSASATSYSHSGVHVYDLCTRARRPAPRETARARSDRCPGVVGPPATRIFAALLDQRFAIGGLSTDALAA